MAFVRIIDILTLTETQSETGNPVRSFTKRFSTGATLRDTGADLRLDGTGNAVIDTLRVWCPYTPATLTIQAGDYVRFQNDQTIWRCNGVIYKFGVDTELLLTQRYDL